MYRLKSLSSVLFVVASFVQLFALNGGVANAISPTLPAGCYNLANGDYTATTCTSEEQARAIVSPLNKCFLITATGDGQSSVFNIEINCQNGRAVVDPQEPPSNEPAKCFRVVDGEAQELECPTTNAIYDDGSGANLIGPRNGQCYVYSPNLYDGDLSYGDPYLEVDCDSLSPCPEGEELRYDDELGVEPICVPVDTPTDNEFAGGADPPSGSDNGNALLEGECKDGLTKEDCAIVGYLINTINILSALAGMAIIGSIMMAGYQYMTARNNSGQIEAAKKRIIWALVALGLFIFMYSLLNWLVPGGIL